MSREGQHVARLGVKGDAKQGVAALDQLAQRQARFEQQTIKTNEVLRQHAKAQDEAAAAAKRAEKAQRSHEAAQQAAAKLHVDTVRRQREALQAVTQAPQQNVRARLEAIEREKAARLSQIEVERRSARTAADAFRLQNQADQVRHDARMARLAAERAAQERASLGAQASSLAQFAAGAAAASLAVDHLATRSLQLANVQANLPFSIDKAREATKGLVSDYDLMRQAIAASRLGVAKTSDDFARLADTSTKLGVSMGVDAATSLDNLVNGLGRASTEVLDNLGITLRAEDAHKLYAERLGKTVKELTDLEKRQAVVTVGLERGAEAASRVHLEVDGMAASWARAKTEIVNVTDALINFGDNARGLVREGLLAIGLTGEQAARSIEYMGEALQTGLLDTLTLGYYSTIRQVAGGLEAFSDEAEELATVAKRGAPSWTLLGHFLGQQGTAAERAAAGWRELADAVQRVADQDAAKNAARWEGVTAAARRGGALFLAGMAQEAEKIEKKRTETAQKEAAKRLEAARAAARAELALSVAGAQRDLELAEAQGADRRELIALIQAQGEAERELAAEEFKWAKNRAEQHQASISFAQSQHAETLALLRLEEAAEQEAFESYERHARAREAYAEAEAAAAKRSVELQAANTGLYRERMAVAAEATARERMEARAREAGQQALRDLGHRDGYGGDDPELVRLQEQVAANDRLREAERALLEQRLAGDLDHAERLRLMDEQRQLSHEAELERIAVQTEVERRQLEEQRAMHAQRRALVQQAIGFSVSMGQTTAQAAFGISRAQKAAAKAAREAGESEAAALRKAKGDGLVALGESFVGQAIGHGAQAAAALATGNFVAAGGHTIAAGLLGAAGAGLIARGQRLAGSGGGAGGSSGAGASFGGGGSSAANDPGYRSGSSIPPSPSPGGLPSRAPDPGNPMGGAAQTPARVSPSAAPKTIYATFHAVSFDRAAVRAMRDELDRLAASEG